LTLEVVGHHGGVVPALLLAQAVLLQVVADLLDRRQAVAQGLGLRAPLGDGQVRALAQAPVVDDVGHHVDGARGEVQRERDRRVLEDPPLGEAPSLAVPERAPPQLVPGHPVVQQRPVAADVRAHPGLGERLGQEADLAAAGARQPVDVARGQV
jgi:hypothetical protein